MQKFLSYLIVFIISVFPIVNASASVSSCHSIMDEHMSDSIPQSMSSDAMADLEDIDNVPTMTSIDDCCEIQKVVCDHSSACDCDNSQANYSAVPSIQIFPPKYIGSFKPPYITSLFHSKSSDSLYRPPIGILT